MSIGRPPSWGAVGGAENFGTVIVLTGEGKVAMKVLGSAGAESATFSARSCVGEAAPCAVLLLATTHPVGLGSTCAAGTGEDMSLPLASRTTKFPSLSRSVASGQPVPAGGFSTQSTSEPK